LEKRSTNERSASIRRTLLGLRVTLALIAINIAVYVAMVVAAHGVVFTKDVFIQFGAGYTPLMRQGEWWRLVTAAFVHGSPDHILWNMVGLYFLGRYLEPRYAPLRFTLLYAVGTLISSAATVVWLWDSRIVFVGASGAISALIGAGAISALHMGERGRAFRNSMLGWGVMVLVNGFLYSANNVAHASGLLTGIALVALFGRRGRAAWAPREAGGLSFDERDGTACGTCGALNPLGSRFCGRCGRSLAEALSQP